MCTVDVQAWSVVSKVWATLGPLVGVLVGAYLARSWDQRRWFLNNRKEEYRELLATLTAISSRYLEVRGHGGLNAINPDEQRELNAARGDGGRIILSRIFVSERIHQGEIHLKWKSLFDEPFDPQQFAEKMRTLHEAILGAARSDLGL